MAEKSSSDNLPYSPSTTYRSLTLSPIPPFLTSRVEKEARKEEEELHTRQR